MLLYRSSRCEWGRDEVHNTDKENGISDTKTCLVVLWLRNFYPQFVRRCTNVFLQAILLVFPVACTATSVNAGATLVFQLSQRRTELTTHKSVSSCDPVKNKQMEFINFSSRHTRCRRFDMAVGRILSECLMHQATPGVGLDFPLHKTLLLEPVPQKVKRQHCHLWNTYCLWIQFTGPQETWPLPSRWGASRPWH